ncbi:MAG: hypothetical protein WBY53_05705 [Acidobacteriaceae bacterium]
MAHLIGTDTPSDALIQPVWTYRVLPALALIALILAQTLVAHNNLWRDFLVGFATGLVLILCVLGFTAKPTNS